MSAKQTHPEQSEAQSKIQTRTVYMHVTTQIECAEDPEVEPERRFVATPLDYPECIGFGFTQEGAFMDAEMKVRRRIEKVSKSTTKGGRSG